MRIAKRIWCSLGFLFILPACNVFGGSTPTPESEVITPTGQSAGTVNTNAKHDNVYIVRNDTRSPLPQGQTELMIVGDSIDVSETGLARLTFPDLTAIEISRDGTLQVNEVAITDQTSSISVKLLGGAAIFGRDEGLPGEHRLEIHTDFATIVATGTRFIVTQETDSSLLWVVALDANGGDLTIRTARGSEKLATGQAYWVSAIDAARIPIQFELDEVELWQESLLQGTVVPEMGEVVWQEANLSLEAAVVLRPNTSRLIYLNPNQSVPLSSELQSTAGIQEQDCNKDGVLDVVVIEGKFSLDLRNVLGRVRRVEVDIVNLSESFSGALVGYNPDQKEIGRTPITVNFGEAELLTLPPSTTPYHFAVLEAANVCLVSVSLKPTR